MKNDSYDLLNEALTIWKINALSKINSGELNKKNQSIPLCYVHNGNEYVQITGVEYDPTIGIVFTSNFNCDKI
jgi:hypothetical protein